MGLMLDLSVMTLDSLVHGLRCVDMIRKKETGQFSTTETHHDIQDELGLGQYLPLTDSNSRLTLTMQKIKTSVSFDTQQPTTAV